MFGQSKPTRKLVLKKYPHQGNDKICLMPLERDDLDIKVIDNPVIEEYVACFTGCIILSHMINGSCYKNGRMTGRHDQDTLQPLVVGLIKGKRQLSN
jgi:hypothetical protein